MKYTDPEYWTNWVPDQVHINSLPEPARKYIHDLERRACIQTVASFRHDVGALIQKVLDLEFETASKRPTRSRNFSGNSRAIR